MKNLKNRNQEEGLDRKQIQADEGKQQKQRKRILIWGLVLNIGILVVFKYNELLTEDRLFYSRSFRDRTRR